MPETTTLSDRQERITLWVLAAVQFTHILDFMLLMPLGAQLMDVFQITPGQFSKMVSVYGFAAALTSLASSAVLDRFDRKKALCWLYGGFVLSTVACALSPNYVILMLARAGAGAFGGVASSMVVAMVGDVIPAARRGRAMGTVMTAFPIASVLGIPFSLFLTSRFSWHAPFLFLSLAGAVIMVFAIRILPSIKPSHAVAHPWQQMKALLSNRIHQRALWLTAALVLAGNCIIPFLAPSMIANVGISEDHLWLVYLAGGVATFFTTPIIGRLSDRHDKLHIIAWVSLGAAAVALTITNLPPSPIWVGMLATAFFMVFMSGRFAPAMAMASNAVEARYRAGFMSVNSSVQQGASGVAAYFAGFFVTKNAAGHLVGYPRLGWISVCLMGMTVWMAYRLRAIAPHAAKNHAPPLPEAVPAE